MVSDGNKAVFRVKFPGHENTTEFGSWHSIESWLKEQIDFWLTLNDNHYSTEVVNYLATEHVEAMRYKDKEIQIPYNQAENLVGSFYSALAGIVKGSSSGNLVKEISDHHPRYLNRLLEVIGQEELVGAKMVSVKDFILALTDDDTDLMQLAEEIDDWVGQTPLARENPSLIAYNRPEVSIGELSKKLDDLDAWARDQLSHQAEFEVLAAESLAKMEVAHKAITATNTTLREELSLLPSVNYWSKRIVAHEDKSDIIQKRLIISAGVALTVIILCLIAVFWAGESLAKVNDFQVILMSGLILFLGTIILWGARIMTRIYLGNIHLANDARERATLIETYLALNLEGAATDTDRAQILAAIFRRSTDGVVRDDGAPLTPATLMGAIGLGSNSKG